MNNHWPLVAAALMISIAVALGLWRRDNTIEALAARDNNTTPRERVRREAPVNLPAEAPATESAAPQPTATPAPAAATGTGTATGASKFALPSAAPAPAPAQPKAAPAAVPAPAPAPAVVPAPAPAPAPAQPKAGPPATPAAPAVPPGKRDQILIDLRASLEGKLTTKATDVVNGGYMLKVTGAQLEVVPVPNWSINIYNLNAQQPETETDNFKVIYSDVAAALGIDVNQKPAQLSNGKTSLQSGSKLGSVSVVRDPANGNSVVITPNQQRKAAQPPPQGQPDAQGRQAPPAQPGTQTIVPPQPLQPPVHRQPKTAAPGTEPIAQPPTQPKP